MNQIIEQKIKNGAYQGVSFDSEGTLIIEDNSPYANTVQLAGLLGSLYSCEVTINRHVSYESNVSKFQQSFNFKINEQSWQLFK